MDTTRYWNEAAETMSRDALAHHQRTHLRRNIRAAFEHSPYYRDKLVRAGLALADLETLDDVTRLSTTSKEDIRLTYPLGMRYLQRVRLASGRRAPSPIRPSPTWPR